MTKPKTRRKLILGAALLLSFALWGVERGETATPEWKLILAGAKKDVGLDVTAYYIVEYMPDQCNVRWCFKNTGAYAADVDVSSKTYTSNYRKSFFVENSDQSFHDNVPNGEARITLGDSISYKDLGWSEGEAWPEVSVLDFSLNISPALTVSSEDLYAAALLSSGDLHLPISLKIVPNLTVSSEASHRAGTSSDLYAAIAAVNDGSSDTLIELTADITLTAPLPPISKSMTIQSDKMGTTRIINASEIGRERRIFHVISASGPIVKFQDLEIRGGDCDLGGGVLIESPKGKVSFEYCRVVANRASEDGGGVFVRRGNVAFKNCEIAGNAASGRGGGVAVEDGDVVFDLCEIHGNTARLSAGGVFLSRDAALRINKTTIEDNKARGHNDNLSTQ